jgi:hypothetical protein
MSRQGRPNAAGNWARQYSCSAATAVGATSASATGATARLDAPTTAPGLPGTTWVQPATSSPAASAATSARAVRGMAP